MPIIALPGTDFSGNNNFWSVGNNNMGTSESSGATYDIMFDTPTDTVDSSGNIIGNYATLSPYNTGGGSTTVTNGNLSATAASTGTYAKILGTLPMSTGKWYWETTITLVGSGANVGIGDGTTPSASFGLGGVVGELSYQSTGNTYTNAVSTAYGATYTTGDIIGVAYDADVGSITFYKNNTSQGTLTGFSGTKYPAVGSSGGTSPQYTVNFGQRAFSYTPPAGFKALNTKNLKDVGSFNLPDTFGNFVNTPDLVWLKCRSSNSFGHRLTDTVRGPTRQLLSHDTAGQSTDNNGLNEFLPNGFNVGSGGDYNTAGQTYVSWNWNRGTVPGFDIVQYSGSGVAKTVAHNLGQAPKFMLVKKISGVQAWSAWHVGIPADQYLVLNTTALPATLTTMWNNQAPGNYSFSVGTDGNTNADSHSYIAYLWAEVPGFSKMGTYSGNTSTDGPFVYTGFRPKWLMVKKISIGLDSWIIYDSVRNAFNGAQKWLVAHGPDSEYDTSTGRVDFVSNGFKIRTADGGVNINNFVYIAYAETPFKYGNAR